MTNPLLNVGSYLRQTRSFPLETKLLSEEINKAYVDIANSMNNRTIGSDPSSQPTVTGNVWNTTGNNTQQQTLRQVYTFTAAGSIPHTMNLTSANGIAQAYGSYTDGTNWYGLIFASNTSLSGQVSFYITPTNIVVQAGGSAPSITHGQLVVEWLSSP